MAYGDYIRTEINYLFISDLGRSFENGTYENMSEYRQLLYKLGYDAGVADYCELDEVAYE